MSVTLPRDIYSHINEFISVEDQPNFRRVNRFMSNLNFPYDLCCTELTLDEIISWILEQSRILSHPITRQYSPIYLPKSELFDSSQAFLVFVSEKTVKKVGINGQNGTIVIGPKTIGSLYGREYVVRNETSITLRHFIQNSTLTFTGYGTKLYQEILSRRLSCFNQRFSLNKCLLEIFLNQIHRFNTFYLIERWHDLFDITSDLLHPLALDKFQNDFSMFFNMPTIDFDKLNQIRIRTYIFLPWLKSWISNYLTNSE